jgi:IclR family KDG regulon transcriptional repressor
MPRYEVEVVRRAFSILDDLAARGGDLGAADLARSSGLGRSTVFRLLTTLQGLGAVRQDQQTRRYRLGAELIALGRSAGDQLDLRSEARPVMSRLADQTDVPVFLNVAGTTSVICVDHVPSRTAIQLYGYAGRMLPFHACPSGYVLLAFGSEDLLERVSRAPLERFASGTPTTAEQLRRIVDSVRRNGVAHGRDDLDERVSSIAAPILDAHRKTVASLGIAGFSIDVEPRLDELTEALVNAAADVSIRLGGPPVPPVTAASLAHNPSEGVLS